MYLGAALQRLFDLVHPLYNSEIQNKLLDNKNQPVVANIRWEDLEAKKTIGIAKSDPEDGSYFIVLPLGKLYGYYIDDDNLFPIASSLDLRNFKKQLNIKNDIIKVCKLIHNKGYVAATDGNVSVRIDKDQFIITPTGFNKGLLTVDDLITIDGDGKHYHQQRS